MRLIARSVLVAYAAAHPETVVSLDRWQRLIRAAAWSSMDDIRRAVPKAKVLNRERVRFEVAGGDYRLIAAFNFRRQIVFVKFVGTHAEYDKVDALTVSIGEYAVDDQNGQRPQCPQIKPAAGTGNDPPGGERIALYGRR